MSKSASETSVQKPTLENSRETRTPSSGPALEPRANPAAPHNTVVGVLGITRITRVLAGNSCHTTAQPITSNPSTEECRHSLQYYRPPSPVCSKSDIRKYRYLFLFDIKILHRIQKKNEKIKQNLYQRIFKNLCTYALATSTAHANHN